MTHHETQPDASSVQKPAFCAAVIAAEKNAVDTEIAERLVGLGTVANQVGTAAGFAKHGLAGNGLRRLRLALHLLKFRALRFVLGFKIGALALKCRVFGLNESDALLEDRRRAMFVDEFFKKIEHRKFSVR